MSSDVVARVQAFAKKANELCDKGHLVRAAENYGRAAEAARAFGADNLVELRMRLRQGMMLGCFGTSPYVVADPGPGVRAAHRAESLALYSGALEVLERRRLAGTLQEGTCAAVEEAWLALEIQQQRHAHFTAAYAASLAKLVGYVETLRAAAYVTDVLSVPQLFEAERCADLCATRCARRRDDAAAAESQQHDHAK